MGNSQHSEFQIFILLSLHFILFCCTCVELPTTSAHNLALIIFNSIPSSFLMLVEEVPKQALKKQFYVYFLSLVSLLARPYFKNADSEDANRNSKNRPKVNYNLTDLLNAQTQANYNSGTVASGVFKSSQQMQLERLISKRLGELSKRLRIVISSYQKRLVTLASIRISVPPTRRRYALVTHHPLNVFWRQDGIWTHTLKRKRT